MSLYYARLNSLAKLADPHETFSKANATLERLLRGYSLILALHWKN
jgi:hypothetical protein